MYRILYYVKLASFLFFEKKWRRNILDTAVHSRILYRPPQNRRKETFQLKSRLEKRKYVPEIWLFKKSFKNSCIWSLRTKRPTYLNFHAKSQRWGDVIYFFVVIIFRQIRFRNYENVDRILFLRATQLNEWKLSWFTFPIWEKYQVSLATTCPIKIFCISTKCRQFAVAFLRVIWYQNIHDVSLLFSSFFAALLKIAVMENSV